MSDDDDNARGGLVRPVLGCATTTKKTTTLSSKRL
jgi:hypothetical protein